MGNHPSAVVDDGQSPVNKQAYTVQGNLHARAVMASTVNAKAIYARSITCQHAQIAQHQTLRRNDYPNPPHRNITAHTVNADIIYADEINCKTLRCYEVYVGDGDQWRAKRVEHIDRNRVTWNGREDVDSEASDDDDDDDQANQRSKRKKAIAIGLGGALAAGLGGAAIAFFKHKHDEKDEKEAKEKEERERKEREEREKKEKADRDKKEKDDLRKRQEEDDRRRREDEDRRRKDDEYRNERDKRDEDDRRRRDEEDRRRREEDERRRHEQHHVLPPSNNNNNQHYGGGGGGGGMPFHQSSRNVRLWSDGNHCFLIADCDAGNGNFQESRIDLDQLVAARNGEFYWVRRGEPGNFSGQAQQWEIMAGGSTMAAQLPQHDGSLQRRQLDLSQFIVNRNGHLSYTNN